MENNNLWLVSIVAIIAIVGMVMFNGNNVGYSTQKANYIYSEENGDIAGQAISALSVGTYCEVIDGSSSGITDPSLYRCSNVCSQKRMTCQFGISVWRNDEGDVYTGDQKIVLKTCSSTTSPISTQLSCMCCK